MCSSNSIWLKKKQKQKKRLGWARVSRPEPHIFAGGDTLERPRICSRNQPFKQSTSLETFKQNVTKEVGGRGGQRIPDGLVFCFFLLLLLHSVLFFADIRGKLCLPERQRPFSGNEHLGGVWGVGGVAFTTHAKGCYLSQTGLRTIPMASCET